MSNSTTGLLKRRRALTPRQLDIARLIADGYTDREIAEWLELSYGTVKTHTHSILQRTDARTRAQAVAVCIRRGWI